MDNKELALTPSMTLDFLPIRPMPSPSDDDITNNQIDNFDGRAKKLEGKVTNGPKFESRHSLIHKYLKRILIEPKAP